MHPLRPRGDQTGSSSGWSKLGVEKVDHERLDLFGVGLTARSTEGVTAAMDHDQLHGHVHGSNAHAWWTGAAE